MATPAKLPKATVTAWTEQRHKETKFFLQPPTHHTKKSPPSSFGWCYILVDVVVRALRSQDLNITPLASGCPSLIINQLRFRPDLSLYLVSLSERSAHTSSDKSQ